MQVKMIFAENRPAGETWLVGHVYDAPADVAASLIRAGRAEPAEPKADAPAQAPAAEGGDPKPEPVKAEPKSAPKQHRRGRK